MPKELRKNLQEEELRLIAEHVYNETGFDFHASDRFDADDADGIKETLAAEIDRLMRKTWVLAGGNPERFSYPSWA